MTSYEMAEQIRELVSGQEILTQKIERLETALRALCSFHDHLGGGGRTALTILNETFPI